MMKRMLLFAVAAGLFVGAANATAQEGSCSSKGKKCCAAKQEKATLSQLRTVTKDQVATMLQASSATIIDARTSEQFEAGHIQGAINFGTAELPSDKNANLVFYCGGGRCPAAAKAAKKALELGYKNVMVYGGGWAEWNKNS